MTTNPLIEVRDLSGGYHPGTDAIADLEFAIHPGSLVAILGPNGGGKTTLFRALLGLLPQRAGEVSIDNPVAYVPQTERARLDFPVTTLDVALMGTYSGARWYRPLGADRRRRALAALEQVGLADLVAKPFGSLSQGQRQRALIARAIAQQARVFLLDEPFSGLDEPSSDRVMSLLAGLRDDGCALLVATHDIQQSREFDLVLCLRKSQVAWGVPSEVLTPGVLERTYGSELIALPDGSRAIVVQHHEH